ncbi:MAG: hypothetical protein MK108_14060 [Mariniblastus sp.]|nr:hypothetical protein [Mariniblastus sp.]
MKRSFTSIPQLYRNVKRWTEIISILSKYRLADWLGRLNIDWMKDWIRMALTELGPTINRLVLGMLTSALFLGSSWMLASAVPPLLFPEQGPWGIRDLSVLGLFGLLGSMLLGFRLVWAIRKSGNLDQQNN